MIRVFQTIDDKLIRVPEDSLKEKGIWINLVQPTEEELNLVASEAQIVPDLLRAALDEEERSRTEVEDNQLLVLINIPIYEGTNGSILYDTIPLGIIVAENAIITVCLKDDIFFQEMECTRIKTFYTFKKTRFVLQILFKTATYYLRYLKQIDKKTSEIEGKLHKSLKNEELIKLLNLEKSLVYFTTSLKANEMVLEKLLRSQLAKSDPEIEETSRILKMYPEDEDILEDVITENKQAIEMAETYNNILVGMMDAFASVISNNLNIVMKYLTSVTIVMALPTMVASFYGMNVALPFQHSPYAFPIALGFSLLLSVAGMILLRRNNMF
jgi:magnesium transporter